MLSPDLMAQVYNGALMNITRWWTRHKDRATREEVIEQVTKLIEKLYGAETDTV